VRVKICGITSSEDALVAAEAGADGVGFVFWEQSPRYVDIARARKIASCLPPFVSRVGVFVNAPSEVLRKTADEVGLDVLQLHGDEAPESLKNPPRRILKAIRVGKGFDPKRVLAYLKVASGILLDAKGETPGGTGLTFDWSLVRSVRKRVAFLVLAGGLNPTNVARAVRIVRPDGVDVSSGVEHSPGRKDPRKIKAFIEALRAAEGKARGRGAA